MNDNDPIKPFLDWQSTFVLDGGLATELEWRGYELNDALWSARLLIEEPQAIKQVHRDYLWAGADCIISASYQASLPGLRKWGLSEAEAVDLLQLSVRLALAARESFWQDLTGLEREQAVEVRGNSPGLEMKDAKETWQVWRKRIRPLVAASIGPYGAYLANGAEYTGTYELDVAGLADWHRRRWHILARSGADLLACETIPSRAELEAFCLLLNETPEMPAWVSFSCRDGRHISDGTPIAECAARLNEVVNVVAIGVNCTPPRLMPELITAVRSATDKHIIVYPNSGERYDPIINEWRGESEPATFGTLSREWRKLGAVMIGGCCRTRPSHIQQVRDRVRYT